MSVVNRCERSDTGRRAGAAAGFALTTNCTGQEMERSRRRLIRLLSAGWLPPCVFRLGAFPASRRRLIRLLSAGWLPPCVFRLGAFPASRPDVRVRRQPVEVARLEV